MTTRTKDVETTITVHTAGSGCYQHRVPLEVGESVWMGDQHSDGTIVVRCERGFYFLSVGDHEPAQFAKECSLVRLSACDSEDVDEPCALDLDSPDGLALIGHDEGDDMTQYGEILWSSAAEQ
jgi:hypothetical protein